METIGGSTLVAPEITEETTRRKQPRYNVVLIDDDEHSYEYVVRMLNNLFSYNKEKAFFLACEVDRSGRVILMTTTREHAELKQEQVHGFGADPLVMHSKGSMRAVLEPIPEA